MITPLIRIFDAVRGPLRPRIVVTGMPKAGTTALAMLLGEAAGLQVNSDPFHRLDQARIEFRDALFDALPISSLLQEHRHEFRGGVLKDPNFVFFLADLLRLFPNAGFVFIVRDPRANIRSILNRLHLPGRPEEAVGRTADVPPTWRRVLEGRTPHVDCADYVQCIVARWKLTVQEFMKHTDRVELIRYEDFKEDKPAAVSSTLRRMGVQASRPIEHMMNQQFQPRGDRSVRWPEFFGEQRLTAIEHDCAVEMAALGYATGEGAPECES